MALVGRTRFGQRTTATATRRSGGRIRWQRALGISVAAFFLWLVIDAPTLQHHAQVSPVGSRRTVALDVLGPIAAFSRAVGLSHVVSVADGVLGRSGNIPGNGSTLRSTGPNVGANLRGAGAGSRPATSPAVASHRSSATGHFANGSTANESLPDNQSLQPSSVDPLRVLVIGDSLGIDMGNALVNDLGQTGVVHATLDGEVGTGLTRPDYYNWPAELDTDLARFVPQVVVVMIGANDAQDFPGPPDVPYGGSQWSAQYGRAVGDFMREATSGGAKLLWVGMPPMRDPALSMKIATLDGIYQAQANQAPGVTYLSSWTVLGTSAGDYTAYVSQGGQDVNVREPDGIHISPGGAEVLSQAIIQEFGSLRVHLPG